MTPEELDQVADRVAELLAPKVEAAVAQAVARPRLGWSPAEAGARIGVDRSTIYRLIDSGALPAARLAGRLIVTDADLRAFLEAAKSGASTARRAS